MKSNTEKTFNVLFEPIDQIEEIIFAYGLESQRLDKKSSHSKFKWYLE